MKRRQVINDSARPAELIATMNLGQNYAEQRVVGQKSEKQHFVD